MKTKFEKTIEKNHIRISCKYGAPVNDEFKSDDGWTCTLKHNRKQLTVPFYMGQGHYGKEPTAADVLSCLISEALSYKGARSFEDFAADFGYDPDSRRAEKIYKRCGQIEKKLKIFLPDNILLELIDHNYY